MTGRADLDGLWAEVRRGKHAAILGAEVAELGGPWSPLVIRVRCDQAPRDLGPLLDARRTILRLLGEPSAEPPRDAPFIELRRRLLGDVPEALAAEAFVDACNRLARESAQGAVLIFDCADAADEASLLLLRRVIGRGAGLVLPLVLAMRSSAPRGAAALVLEAIRASGGVVATATPRSAPAPAAAPAHPTWRSLPPGALRVLRAGAAAGPVLDAPLVARLLGLDVLEVLEGLQLAADAGVAIEDQGDLRFRLPDSLAAELGASLLPSLARAWRGALSESEDAPTPPPRAFAASEGSRVRDVEPAVVDAAREPAFASAPRGASPVASDEPLPRAAAGARARAAPPRARSAASPAAMGDPADAEIARLVAAAGRAEEMGAYGQAIATLRRAAASLSRPPDTPERRVQRASCFAEIGRLSWAGAGPEYDFSLPGALEALLEARGELRPADPPALLSHIAVLIANVCYDLGDLPSLERALRELTEASQALLASGDAYGAARLLNDQAAVYVRMGDPVQAVHLLEQSRKVFAERADRDPIALREVAETDHLLARIPLHVAPRPGKEEEAIAAAMKHAESAEGAFRRFRARRELARVWETMGRLELAAGRLDAALERLLAAVRSQEAAGDAIGLARTTAALSGALEQKGDHDQALALLRDSVRLNVAKGSPLGLAFNRRSLAALEASPAVRRAAGEALAQAAEEIAAAERELGKISLPGEAG